MIPLYEEYRPRDWSEVAGQSKAIARINTLRRRGLEGRIYWITGQSGTGKTTIARLIAEEVADPCIVEELDGSKLLTARVDAIEQQCHGRPSGGRAGVGEAAAEGKSVSKLIPGKVSRHQIVRLANSSALVTTG